MERIAERGTLWGFLMGEKKLHVRATNHRMDADGLLLVEAMSGVPDEDEPKLRPTRTSSSLATCKHATNRFIGGCCSGPNRQFID
mmetsp:Transcript_69258/g.144390  ORF Transcript_69258/g.144390 Transcript_69258/m.144390 type:complete len:85 (+) Transcript_69258:88-342(+)